MGTIYWRLHRSNGKGNTFLQRKDCGIKNLQSLKVHEKCGLSTKEEINRQQTDATRTISNCRDCVLAGMGQQI